MDFSNGSSFLVSGEPDDQKDLNGWRAFQDSIKSVRKDDCVVAHVKTYLYGGEEMVDATPEEVAYIHKRIEMRPDFLEKRTQKIKEYDLLLWVEK